MLVIYYAQYFLSCAGMGESIFLGGGIKSVETLCSILFPNSISPDSELNHPISDFIIESALFVKVLISPKFPDDIKFFFTIQLPPHAITLSNFR